MPGAIHRRIDLDHLTRLLRRAAVSAGPSIIDRIEAVAAVTPKKLVGDFAQTTVTTITGEVKVVCLAEWTLDWKRKTVDETTTDDSEYESSQGSTKSWTAKAKFMFLDGDASQSTYVLSAIDEMVDGEATWNFYPTVETGRSVFQGTAIIDGITLSSGTGKVVAFDVSLKGTAPLLRLTQAAPVSSSLIMADTVTGSLYRLAIVSDALEAVAYSGSSPAGSLHLTDAATGTVYLVTVANGAITWTASGVSGAASVAIVDDVSGVTYQLSISNNALTWA